jgi:hypothetical protein
MSVGASSNAAAMSYRTYLHELVTIYSCESLPDWFDAINEGLEHKHVVDGLLSMLEVNLRCKYDELVK